MRNVKKLFMGWALVVCILASVLGYSNSAQAKSKKTTYYFSSCEVTKFNLKNNKLTIATDKRSKNKTGIYIEGNEKNKKYKVTYKVAKNCKWVEATFSRYNGKSSSSKSTYKNVKKCIKFDRNWYKENGSPNNFGLCSFVVKNKKIIKVRYFFM